MFRVLAIFFVVMIMVNLSLLGYHFNQVNDFQNSMNQMIAKEGCIDKNVKDYAIRLSNNRYKGMFSIRPAKNEYLPKRDINGKDLISPSDIHGKSHPGKTVTVNYTQPQNYGKPIKYIIDMDVPTFSLGGKNSWARLGSIHNTHESQTVSQLPQHDLNQEQQSF